MRLMVRCRDRCAAVCTRLRYVLLLLFQSQLVRPMHTSDVSARRRELRRIWADWPVPKGSRTARRSAATCKRSRRG